MDIRGDGARSSRSANGTPVRARSVSRIDCGYLADERTCARQRCVDAGDDVERIEPFEDAHSAQRVQHPWRDTAQDHRRADTGRRVSILLEASKGVASSEKTPMVMADAGGENFNGAVDELVEVGILRRVLAYTELKFSNSMIEAWWRSLKHQWLFLHSLDRMATVRRLVEFYVQQHNAVLPHSAFRGQTPDEVYFGTGDDVPGDLDKRKTEARRRRFELNRTATCHVCPSSDVAA